MKHYDYEINLFVDGELTVDEEKKLFIHLSDCDECRKEFSEILLLKEKSRKFISDEISKLTGKLNRRVGIFKVTTISSVAASIVLLLLLLTSKPEKEFYTKNIVRVDTIYVSKSLPITQTKITKGSLNTPREKRPPESSSQKEYLRYVMNLRKVEFNGEGTL